jgi:hypothetical protein
MDTRVNFSLAYHPQTDGQTERVNQILEDMLRACALKNKKSWDKCLPYAEFSYNNSYQESLKMSPFEVLYGRRCRTPLFWNEPGENQVFGQEILREAERQVQVVRETSVILCPKSVAHEGTLPFQDMRKACAKVYWTLQGSRAKR